MSNPTIKTTNSYKDRGGAQCATSIRFYSGLSSLWGRKKAIRRPSDVEIREELTKRSAFRSLRVQSTPQCHNAAFAPGTFARCFGAPRQKCPPPSTNRKKPNCRSASSLRGRVLFVPIVLSCRQKYRSLRNHFRRFIVVFNQLRR